MDDGSRAIVAAAAGTVEAAVDDCFDRCTSGTCDCGDGFGNYVRIDHADGKRTYYGHIKNGSVQVNAGDVVACGTVLGRVGSSGFSTGPDLHFEVRFDNNVADDPYAGDCGGPTSYWGAQGEDNGLPGTSCGDAPPPPPEPTTGTARGAVFKDKGVGTDDMTTRLAGASVSIVGTALATAAEGVDADWIFATAPSGTVTLRASAPGYLDGERTCDVLAGDTAWCSIGLVLAAGGEGEGEGEADAGEGEPIGPDPREVARVSIVPPEQAAPSCASASAQPLALALGALLQLKRRLARFLTRP